ncbi:agamous-like MADS-box protein AGL61 [Quercus robur]|uniref:agamous-like MADS-box protein AGL61 n=1 Tax=Quercus robur TaxID=38942 RepID=UPI0021636D25|nr:agamous-like MADS-box protein AGL61 [Quercus robur]
MSMNKAKSKGRQKIENKLITDYRCREVTFSKRKSGLFKSASELCILCGAKIGIAVFSLTGKPFCFGNPDINTIIDQYVSGNPQTNVGTGGIVESLQRATILELSKELDMKLKELEIEKERGEAIEKLRKEIQQKLIWEAPIEELGLRDLQQLSLSLENLKKKIHARVHELYNGASSSSSSSSWSLPSADATHLVGAFITETSNRDMEWQAQRQNEELNISLDCLTFDAF